MRKGDEIYVFPSAHRHSAGNAGVPLRPLQPDHDLEGKVTRRFPAPWRADKMPGGYVVRDANGQALVYVYSRESEAEAMQAKVLTADEARRIAVNVAKLPPGTAGVPMGLARFIIEGDK